MSRTSIASGTLADAIEYEVQGAFSTDAGGDISAYVPATGSPMRIEISEMKAADSLAIIMATAMGLGRRQGELDYNTHVRPALLAKGAILTLK